MRGFTLIEVMIVVVIVAILVAIAVPGYQNQITASRRSDAQGTLQSFAQAMERFYTQNGTYIGAAGGTATSGAPTIFSTKSPVDGAQTYYQLTISTMTANSYTLQATPVNAQAGDGNMTLNSAGVRFWANGTW
ncbi:type IV pilin protein [Aurantivibrio infirmus]